jgi:hypothetical protein
MAPSPSRPFSRSSTKATAASMARLREPSGKKRLGALQDGIDAAEDLRPGPGLVRPLRPFAHLLGGVVNSSPIAPRAGSSPRLERLQTRSGTITVRAQ